MNAFSDAHCGPFAAAIVVSGNRGVKRLRCFGCGANRIASDELAFETVRGLDTDRRKYLVKRAVPCLHFTIAEVFALVDQDGRLYSAGMSFSSTKMFLNVELKSI